MPSVEAENVTLKVSRISDKLTDLNKLATEIEQKIVSQQPSEIGGKEPDVDEVNLDNRLDVIGYRLADLHNTLMRVNDAL